jgi:single-strand DNA-binding protein
MNNYSTIGRLTRDPETKFTPQGKGITSFAIAMDVGFGDKKKTIFWECKIWGERGETFTKYVFKGHQVGIEARIEQEEWVDKATQEQRKKLVLVVNDFTLLSNGEKGQRAEYQQKGQEPKQAAPRKVATAAVVDEDNSEIPW